MPERKRFFLIEVFPNIFEEKKKNFWLTEIYIQPSFALLLISTLIGHCYSETEEAPYKVENSCKNVNAPTTISSAYAVCTNIMEYYNKVYPSNPSIS